MELIVCFGLAVSVFAVVIGLIVGLVSAPTPILLGILVAGMMLTQKSIDNFTATDVALMDEKDKDKIEKVEMNPSELDHKNILKSMVYRGLNYNAPTHIDQKIVPHYSSKEIQYRGVKSSHKNSEIV
jgi:hypothetical protein